MIRVLVADDHPVARAAVLDLLQETDGMSVVGAAEDGEQVIDLVHETQPDVVLMDVSMPTLSGIDATRRLASEGSDVRVLMFSAQCRPSVVRAAKEAGARGFLAKGCRGTDILRAIRTVSRGRSTWPAPA